MTRFARAKGSKASNERVPNEATPWHVMKQQLKDKISTKNCPPAKAKTAKQLLDGKNDLFYSDSIGNVNNDWAEFERPKVRKSKKLAGKFEVKSKNAPVSKKNKKKLKKLDNKNIKVQDINDSDTQTKPKSQKRKPDILESVKVKSAKVEVADNTEANSPVILKKKAKKRKSDDSLAESAQAAEVSTKVETVSDAEAVSAKKKLKKQKSRNSTAESIGSVAERRETNDAEFEPKPKKKKKKDKSAESCTEESTEVCEVSKEKVENANGKRSSEVSVKMSKRQKRNLKQKNKNAGSNAIADGVSNGNKAETSSSGGFDAEGNEWSTNVNFGNQRKFEKKLNGPTNGNQGSDFKKPMVRVNGTGNNAVKRKAPKIRDNKEHKRRKPDVGSIKCTINGMDVEIVKYDGFPVKKEDADRLKDLRQQMILKGIPKSEIDAAMKLERRKAEKALARVRKQVCFHCRKAGHNLSDCPELGEGESATGICFKCGSTEHTHFECKVTKKQEYGFASCFICREQGHIAKQCPDNPKGLYPQGGSCKICGDVTHLKKDCPDLTKEKEENTMTLSTIAENTLESLDEDAARTPASDDGKKAKGKIVKF